MHKQRMLRMLSFSAWTQNPGNKAKTYPTIIFDVDCIIAKKESCYSRIASFSCHMQGNHLVERKKVQNYTQVFNISEVDLKRLSDIDTIGSKTL